MQRLYKQRPKIATIFFSFLLFSATHSYADTVYTWKENGVTVLSGTKPTGSQKYEVLDVREPTTIKTTQPSNAQINTLAATAQSTQQPVEKTMRSKTIPYTITSPQNDESIFNYNPTLAIETSPSLTDKDKPIVHINGSAVPLVFQNGTWTINRPNPGENTLSISGTTANGDQIESNSIVFYIHNQNINR